MLIMELPVGAKKEKKEVALNNLSAIMDRWAAANIIHPQDFVFSRGNFF